MKLKGKLAKEYIDPKFINEFEGYDCYPDEAFIAGFEKAREMAIEQCDTVSDIKELGEEEVE